MLNAVIENKEGYKICGSSIRVEDKDIFIFLTLDVPSKKTSYTPVTGRTMGVALGYDSPLVCCITENDKDSKFFAVGENLDFVENRKKRHEKYRQIQSATKECHGGNGRKRNYKKENGLLTYYIRFGVCSGEHCIPYDLIREFEITR